MTVGLALKSGLNALSHDGKWSILIEPIFERESSLME
jgi:hypothetical protein